MKKLALSIAIILGLGMTAFADGDNNNGGLFKRGTTPDEETYGGTRDNPALMLPGSHGQDIDQTSPLGSGVAVLLGLGAAYLVAKRSKEE